MIIIGAGLAGLLAGNLLRHKSPTILERQTDLPNNHSAVLRFRSSIISDATGIAFKKVRVIKATLPWLNPVADALAYSGKNTGVSRSDRSLPPLVENVERYIAPVDLINRLATNLEISYNTEFDGGWAGPVISTIPMPNLMRFLNYPRSMDFPAVIGYNISARIASCDAYASLYTPNPFYPFSRVSLTGDCLIAEIPQVKYDYHSPEEDYELILAASGLFGISPERVSDVKITEQLYSKIQPIDEGERNRFMIWATDNYNIYSLGRYACWRPGLLLDDLVKDIRLIDRWINDGYGMEKHRLNLLNTGE